MRHVLFVCGKNRRRSPTAEAIFAASDGFEVSSAGTAADAECVVSSDLVEWADEIVVMERRYARQLRQKFSAVLGEKRIVSLDIPDNYMFMQDELIAVLQARSARCMK